MKKTSEELIANAKKLIAKAKKLKKQEPLKSAKL
jgi:hypothetical protein